MLTCVGLYVNYINCTLISMLVLSFSRVSELEQPVVMGYSLVRPRGKCPVNVRLTIGYVGNNTL
jgi:hypothetical protein